MLKMKSVMKPLMRSVELKESTELSSKRHFIFTACCYCLNEPLIVMFDPKTSAPKKWIGPDGKETSMDTRYTMRARQLRDIYGSITMKYVTQDERLDALLTLKHTVKVNCM